MFICFNHWIRPVVRDLVDDIITVNELEIINAMKLCYEILKVVVEPSAAVGLAAVLSEKFKCNASTNSTKNVGIILTGGNVDLSVLWDSINKWKHKTFDDIILSGGNVDLCVLGN